MLEFLKCIGLAFPVGLTVLVLIEIRLRAQPKEKQAGSTVPEHYRQPKEDLTEINA